MNRIKKPKFELTSKLTATEKALLLDKIKTKEVEIVAQNGALIGWSDSDDVDEIVLDHIKKDKVVSVYNLPERYVKVNDEYVRITTGNIKDFDKKYFLKKKDLPQPKPEVFDGEIIDAEIVESESEPVVKEVVTEPKELEVPDFDIMSWAEVKDWIKAQDMSDLFDLRKEQETRDKLEELYG